MTIFIYARDILGAVGTKEGNLPWDTHNKVDMKLFKAQTDNKLVLCGLNTFNSLPPFAIERMKPLVLVNVSTPIDILSNIIERGGKPATFEIVKTLLPTLTVIGGMKLFKKLLPYLSEVSLHITTRLEVHSGDFIRDTDLLNLLHFTDWKCVYADENIIISETCAKVNSQSLLTNMVFTLPESPSFRWPEHHNNTILLSQGGELTCKNT